jgi:DNA mismatch repair protein MLH3
MQDLTKNFLAQLEADGTEHWPGHGPMAPPDIVELNPVDETALNADTNWTRALRWCPQDILDLINSKACRGANGFLTLLPVLNLSLP